MNLTGSQQSAITARGNVLVVAGAGTGKTRTLVDRCLHVLSATGERVSLDELLLVTFTEAAAAEMRRRIRSRIQERIAADPADAWWAEQQAIFDAANIGTLHSFCLRLVREHFYELELDPQVSVLAPEEGRLLAQETLDKLLQPHYEGGDAFAASVQRLIQIYGRGADEAIRALVLKLHDYTQTLPGPELWLRGQLAMFESPDPVLWREWLLAATSDWRGRWLAALSKPSSENKVAEQCLGLLREFSDGADARQRAAVLQSVLGAVENCPRGKKKAWLEPIEGLFGEAEFLHSLSKAPGDQGLEPLGEDWSWVREDMATLLQLASSFSEAFTGSKRELGVLDFHDLEQYALRL